MNNLVYSEDNKFLTNSKIIADIFSKKHRDITKVIDDIKDDDFKKLNFLHSSYISPQNKELFCYSLTLKGFIFLIAGFTGSRCQSNKKKAIDYFHEANLYEMLLQMDVVDLPEDRFVYIAKEAVSGRFKVGISKHPEQRVKELNVGNPEELILIHYYKANKEGFLSETLAHRSISEHHIRSEWFDKGTVIGEIGQLKNQLT